MTTTSKLTTQRGEPTTASRKRCVVDGVQYSSLDLAILAASLVARRTGKTVRVQLLDTRITGTITVNVTHVAH